MIIEKEPDGFEKGVRFVCGALVGGGVAAWAAVGEAWSRGELVGVVVGVAVVFGGCAVRFGDRFWRALLGMGSW